MWREQFKGRAGETPVEAIHCSHGRCTSYMAIGHGAAFQMSDTRLITNDVARAFLEDRKSHDLNAYEEIEGGAAMLLATCRGGLHLNGLRVLSEECAEALAAHSGGYLELNGIAVLSERAAQLLATYKCPSGYRPPGLSLTGLTSIPATPGHLALARLLSGHDGVLFLKCLTSLEDEAAEVLASHTGPLCLDALTTLSDKAAEALAWHKGDLSLQGIVALSDSAAASLARHEGYLKLAGVKFLADAAAGHLARHNGLLSLVAVQQLHETPGHIALAKSLVVVGGQGVFRDDGRSVYLNGLKSLSRSMGVILAKAKDLGLNGLSALPDAVAEVLSLHTGGGLSLDGVSMLSDNAAASLSRHAGASLSLNGLASLSEPACLSLASYAGGKLSLNGLSTLTPRNCAALSKYAGDLSLRGVSEISDEAAQQLSSRKSLTDVNVAGLSQSAARILRTITKPIATAYKSGKWPGVKSDAVVVRDLTPMVALDDDAAVILAQCEGMLALDGLSTLSDKAASALAKHKVGLRVIRLNGLKSLSEKAVAALAASKAALELNGLTALSDKAAESLKKHKGDLSLTGVTSVSRKGVEVLAKFEGQCLLMSLRSLPGDLASTLRANPNIYDND